MPDVLPGIKTIAIVPYYCVTDAQGREYERIPERFGCPACSWRGFTTSSPVDFDVFRDCERICQVERHRQLPAWRSTRMNTARGLPIPSRRSDRRLHEYRAAARRQPNGDVNFCVDFPDYVVGNARASTLAELWNSERAERFRACRRSGPLPVCHRCGAKYMSGA